MSQVQLQLSWDSHQKSICNGLSQLQQRGEFVDMTLAADGHHVRVHQMVMSLVSPYIKDLLSTAPCPHPVIFLNNVSYTTLRSILEYIYTGEVLVAKENLSDIIAAGKALHIKGLKEMSEPNSASQCKQDPVTYDSVITLDDNDPPKTSLLDKLKEFKEKKRVEDTPKPICKIFVDEAEDTDTHMDTIEEFNEDPSADYDVSPPDKKKCKKVEDSSNTPHDLKSVMNPTKLQYSVSNQGGLQLVHNRYIYHLRYVQKKGRSRLWRCVDYSSNVHCRATIFTDDSNQVVSRTASHNHPFHDKKIIRKIQLGIIFGAFQDAENESQSKLGQKNVPYDQDSSDEQQYTSSNTV